MKKILWMIISLAAALLPVSCNGFLDQLPSGNYTDENYADYPALVRGYVEKAYSLRPSSYLSTPGMACDGYADNMAWRDRGSAMWRFCTGASTMSDDPLSGLWTRDYTGIYYCNLFLHESLGLGMRYMVNAQADKNLRSALQGDAFGLRAWFLYELLKYYGGRSTAGDLLGVPVFTEPVDPAKADLNTLRRATYDDCMKQILADCEAAGKNFYFELNSGWYQTAFFFATGANLTYDTDDAGNFTACNINYASPEGLIALKKMVEAYKDKDRDRSSMKEKLAEKKAVVAEQKPAENYQAKAKSKEAAL